MKLAPAVDIGLFDQLKTGAQQRIQDRAYMLALLDQDCDFIGHKKCAIVWSDKARSLLIMNHIHLISISPVIVSRGTSRKKNGFVLIHKFPGLHNR